MADGQAQAQGPLPQNPAVQAFNNLRLELSNVSQALTVQGISTTVSKFDGNPKNYREWIKTIEKYAILVNAPDDRKNYSLINPQQVWLAVLFKGIR